MLVVRNLFHPHHKRALSTNEDTRLLPPSSGTEEHVEHHAINPRIISDVILVLPTTKESHCTDEQGLSDGLTVPFALSAGLSAFGSAKLVIAGGFAELVCQLHTMGK